MNVDPAKPMLWVLRDHQGLVSTRYGYSIAQCGTCTWYFGNVVMHSCHILVSAVGEKAITTIEGLSETENHPVQKAWLEHDVAQCGYCQAGQIMNAATLFKNNANPSDEEIETSMNGNIYRSATYVRIRATINTAATSKSPKTFYQWER